MPAIRLLVCGRVQGVGFRWFVRVTARHLGLAGWVANQPDGTVEIAVSGDRGKLDELKRIVRRGPAGAHVSAVDEVPAAEDLEFPFAVRR